MKPQWKKFNNAPEQLEEMRDAEHGWIILFKDGQQTFPEKGGFSSDFNIAASRGLIDQYLICSPLPHLDMRIRHAMTGQPVYFFKEVNECWKTTSYPAWLEQIKYSFNPPREKKFIEVRDYLILMGAQYSKHCVHRSGDFEDDLELIVQHEKRHGFVRWIDQDWRRIEI